MFRNGIKDLIGSGKHKETGLYHGLYYINHPPPSGEPRIMLWHSTKEGFKTPEEAINVMKSAFTEEQLKEIEVEGEDEQNKRKPVCDCSLMSGGSNCYFNKQYDAWFCSKCNVWLERKCPDEDCEYCKDRPDKPSEIIDD